LNPSYIGVAVCLAKAGGCERIGTTRLVTAHTQEFMSRFSNPVKHLMGMFSSGAETIPDSHEDWVYACSAKRVTEKRHIQEGCISLRDIAIYSLF
jgi:hypothetical protein